MKQCGVCSRQLLVGEVSIPYRTRFRRTTDVCSLCVDRAETRGWGAESRSSERQLVGRSVPFVPRHVIGAQYVHAAQAEPIDSELTTTSV